MATITIEKTWNLQKTHFVNTDELLNYLLLLSSSEIEYEELSQEETQMINSLKSANKFKNIVKNLKI